MKNSDAKKKKNPINTIRRNATARGEQFSAYYHKALVSRIYNDFHKSVRIK